MAPKLIQFKCPKCTATQNPIPADMGDKTIKCRVCGSFIHYGWRKREVEIVKRPERVASSGLSLL